jgi:hypothetical protein
MWNGRALGHGGKLRKMAVAPPNLPDEEDCNAGVQWRGRGVHAPGVLTATGGRL